MPDVVTLPESENLRVLPPVIAGANTPEIARQVENFFHSVASICEAWVKRRKSDHTRRAYRGDVMAFVEFRGWEWPKDSGELLRVSILDVQAFREDMLARRGSQDDEPADLVAILGFMDIWLAQLPSCDCR